MHTHFSPYKTVELNEDVTFRVIDICNRCPILKGRTTDEWLLQTLTAASYASEVCEEQMRRWSDGTRGTVSVWDASRRVSSHRCPSWRGDVSQACPALPLSVASALSPGKERTCMNTSTSCYTAFTITTASTQRGGFWDSLRTEMRRSDGNDKKETWRRRC